jgi:hypothetical protein
MQEVLVGATSATDAPSVKKPPPGTFKSVLSGASQREASDSEAKQALELELCLKLLLLLPNVRKCQAAPLAEVLLQVRDGAIYKGLSARPVTLLVPPRNPRVRDGGA